MRALTAFVAIVLACSFDVAGAQESSPVATYFQQYRQALESGDLAGAEAAASAALEASRSIDGEGGSTGVLALNLARVRAQLGQWQEARAPAEQAYALSRRGGAAGLDPAMSELLWGRVRLATEGFRGSAFLSNALERYEERADLLGDRYDAAAQLGLWAMQTHNYVIARGAWSRAADTAQGAPFDQNYALGQARAYEGMAIALQSITREIRMSPIVARQVRERLREAHELIRPFAFSDSAELTAPQELFAQILAWDGVVWSKMASENPGREDDPTLDSDPIGSPNAPFCVARRIDGDRPFYPAQQLLEGQISAVVLRLRFDEHGSYLGATVAAAVGHEDLERNATAAVATWRYATQMEGSCRVLPIQYTRVVFAFRD
jgi:TonB family protein